MKRLWNNAVSDVNIQKKAAESYVVFLCELVYYTYVLNNRSVILITLKYITSFFNDKNCSKIPPFSKVFHFAALTQNCPRTPRLSCIEHNEP